jgi:hypothetical protein
VLVSPPGRAFGDYAHIRAVSEGNAALVADGPGDVVEHIGTYLREPRLHSAERARLALAECGPSDGRAGERIARRLLEQMGAPLPDEASAAPPAQELSLRST